VQVCRLLYGYENLKGDIAVPVRELKDLSVTEEKLKEPVNETS
jgi:hypothetical protein